mmetsp:Transcript_20055/g.32614  ORF Transcript_20055/g.32614 Transcript_20055/m.32614 type:complete len:251 (-) Transcript_20055:80-832(-)
MATNLAESSKPLGVHILYGGSNLFPESDQGTKIGMRYGMSFSAFLALIVTLTQIAGHLTAKEGWKKMQSDENRHNYTYGEIDPLFQVSAVCHSLIALSHFLLGVLCLLKSFENALKELLAAGAGIAFLSSVFSVYIEVAVIEFLKDLQKSSSGYCASGDNRSNGGCDDMIAGFQLVRDIGIVLITLYVCSTIIYLDKYCMGKTGLGLTEYGGSPPDLPPLAIRDEDGENEDQSSLPSISPPSHQFGLLSS